MSIGRYMMAPLLAVAVGCSSPKASKGAKEDNQVREMYDLLMTSAQDTDKIRGVRRISQIFGGRLDHVEYKASGKELKNGKRQLEMQIVNHRLAEGVLLTDLGLDGTVDKAEVWYISGKKKVMDGKEVDVYHIEKLANPTILSSDYKMHLELFLAHLYDKFPALKKSPTKPQNNIREPKVLPAPQHEDKYFIGPTYITE